MHRTIFILISFFVAAFAVPPSDKPIKAGTIVGVAPFQYEVDLGVGYLLQVSKISMILICNAVRA
jgi:hypothetical protein